MDEIRKKILNEHAIKKSEKALLKEAIKTIFKKHPSFMNEIRNMVMGTSPTISPETKPVVVPTTTPVKQPDPRELPNPGIETKPKAIFKR